MINMVELALPGVVYRSGKRQKVQATRMPAQTPSDSPAPPESSAPAPEPPESAAPAPAAPESPASAPLPGADVMKARMDAIAKLREAMTGISNADDVCNTLSARFGPEGLPAEDLELVDGYLQYTGKPRDSLLHAKEGEKRPVQFGSRLKPPKISIVLDMSTKDMCNACWMLYMEFKSMHN